MMDWILRHEFKFYILLAILFIARSIYYIHEGVVEGWMLVAHYMFIIMWACIFIISVYEETHA